MAEDITKASKKKDLEAIEKALGGEEEGFVFLKKKYQRLVETAIRKMVRNEEDARDLVQETFIKAFEALSHYDPKFAFSSWLYKIAANNCVDYLRKKRFDHISLERSKDEEEYVLEIRDETPEPDKKIIDKEIKAIVKKAIADLPEKYRIIISLRHEKEMEYSEIAEKLEIPIGTVKARLFRARKLLFERLKKERALFADV